MTENNLTPSSDLVHQWNEEALLSFPDPSEWSDYIATQASRWGAEQRLEAICDYIAKKGKWFANPDHRLAELRIAMNPKPPSLAEQAIEAHLRVWANGGTHADWELIRAALERLQELEQNN